MTLVNNAKIPWRVRDIVAPGNAVAGNYIAPVAPGGGDRRIRMVKVMAACAFPDVARAHVLASPMHSNRGSP
jgi:hypothetical protein